MTSMPDLSSLISAVSSLLGIAPESSHSEADKSDCAGAALPTRASTGATATALAIGTARATGTMCGAGTAAARAAKSAS